VVDKDGLLGMISGSSVKDVPREKWFETKVLDVCDRKVTYAYPDSMLQDILDIMYTKSLGRIPIVDRKMPRKMVGIVAKTDIIRAVERKRLVT
jgi:CIC family chloride channel protein